MRIAPLPRAARLVGGLGFHEGRAVVCVALRGHGTATPRTFVTRAIRLVVTNDDPGRPVVDWALVVDESHRFVRVEPLGRGETDERLPDWIGRARTEDGRVMGWIDVPAMLRDLGGAP